ncbi:hypothetical protein K2X05_04495 [bacterium]|nr:hypothetical protein [bacterium]
MGSRFIKWFILFIFILGTVTSCTTSESENAEGVEEELEGAEDVEASADSAEETTEETAKDDTTEEKPDGEEAEDDEFLAEDSASPAEPAKEKLEEKDLQNELEKETIANKDPAAPPVDAEAEAATVPPATATVTPNPTEDPLMGAEVAASAETTSATTPLSKDSANDGFEVINPTVPQEDLGVSDPLVAEVDPPLPSVKAAQEVVPLSKINKDPFFRNERLMNTVYIVRPNEDLAIVSQKIFNEDKTSILFADNPHLSKGVEAGDKIYYNSPNRPDDKKIILTYFEDNKMSPQYYVTRKGDDIKKIGREVLGHEDGWKEIWATNESLQTQALLPSGLKVRYWSGSEPKSFEPSNVASSSEATSAVSGTMTEKEPAPVESLPEIPPSEPVATLPTEDPGMATPPPPVPSESAPMVASSNEVPSVKSAENDSLITIAAIAMIAMAVLGIVAIQIKNRRRDDGSLPPSLEFTKV